MERAQGSVVAGGVGVGREERVGHRGLGGSDTALYDTAKVKTCHYALVKTHGVYNTKTEP